MRKTRRLGDLGLDLLALEQELQSVAVGIQAGDALRAAAAGESPTLISGKPTLVLSLSASTR